VKILRGHIFLWLYLLHQGGDYKHKKEYKKEFVIQDASRWRKHTQREIKERNFGGSLGSD